MDGAVVIGIGLSLIAVSGPICVGLLRRSNGRGSVGRGDACMEHTRQLAQLEQAFADHLKHHTNLLDRLDSKDTRIDVLLTTLEKTITKLTTRFS